MIYLLATAVAYLLLGKLLRWRLTVGSEQIPPKTIRLTYDDGPGFKLFPKLLRLLDEENVPATFFLLGRNVEKHPLETEQVLATDHQIGSHTQNHRWIGWLFPWISFRDIHAGMKTLQNVGVRTRLFRPPFGHVPFFTGLFLLRAKLKTVFWDVMPYDWKENPMAPEDVVNRLVENGGGTVLLHAHDRNEKHERYVLETTRTIIQFAKAHGWKFEKVMG